MSGENSKEVGNAWLSLSAIGGLISILAIPGYIFAAIVPLVFSYSAYINYKLPENKRKFLLLVLVNFAVGVVLRFFPHEKNGGLAGLGFFLGMAVFATSCFFVFKMFRLESARSPKSNGDI